MTKNLLIVESPAKAKTIEKYLGGDFTVLSSVGHIRSIAKKTKDGTPPIDVKNGFKTTYDIDPEKRKVVSELKKAAKNAKDIYLATDPDREGEAIAWHLCEVLGLDPQKTKRITYQEISQHAIQEALKKAHTIDMHLVQAQQARQILDRIVGFELSPVVWQKVPGGKSAGRVQSPAVRLLVEREREIRAFESSFQFKVTALFTHDSEEIKAELPQRFDTEKEATVFLENLKNASFRVQNVTKTPGTRNPAAPFTTSTLQQDANAKLGFGSKATMASAQKLYQDGKITYMRTDSVNLSGQAISNAKEYISKQFGNEYSHIRQYKTKNSNAQEAHEAIRPTDMSLEIASTNEYDQKLYDLIRRRTLASQMASAKLEKTIISIEIASRSTSSKKYIFEAKGEVITFDGFLRVYGKNKEEILPSLSSGDVLDLTSAQAKQLFSKPPARYTEGSLVKKLEELGIGRPSTYATIINTVQVRGYAERGEGEGIAREVVVLSYAPASSEKSEVTREIVQEKTGADRGKLVPTPAGELISDFLTNHFDKIVDYGFTAEIEDHMDHIASNKLARNTMLHEFYDPFMALIKKSSDIDRKTVGANREVGIDPKTNKPIIARFGRFGPMLQLGTPEDEEKPQFAPLPKGTRIESITLEQALEAFKLPRLVGQTEDGQDITANIGRFGPYIQVGKLYVSITPLDPHDITLSQARELYEEKLKKEAEKNIANFGDGIKILNGRWGAYITDGKKNAKIPKDIEPKKITHDEAKKFLAEAPERKGRARRFTKKK
jgi:DNA topoisomerase-1